MRFLLSFAPLVASVAAAIVVIAFSTALAHTALMEKNHASLCARCTLIQAGTGLRKSLVYGKGPLKADLGGFPVRRFAGPAGQIDPG